MIPRAALACIGFIATGFGSSVECARANDLLFGEGYGARAVEPCDPFAEDPDAVLPPGTCMRFGGRVRVDLGAQGQPQAGRGYGAAPAAVRVDDGNVRSPGQLDLPGRLESGMTRSHLRVPTHDGAGSFDPAAAR